MALFRCVPTLVLHPQAHAVATERQESEYVERELPALLLRHQKDLAQQACLWPNYLLWVSLACQCVRYTCMQVFMDAEQYYPGMPYRLATTHMYASQPACATYVVLTRRSDALINDRLVVLLVCDAVHTKMHSFPFAVRDRSLSSLKKTTAKRRRSTRGRTHAWCALNCLCTCKMRFDQFLLSAVSTVGRSESCLH